MKKVTKLVMMLCLIITGALCYAHGTNQTGEGHVLTKVKAHYGGTDKSESIVISITGHILSVVFLENLGQVAVEVTTANGEDVDASSIYTPNGVNFYIANTGSYIVTFTLPNGDEYYGEFEVTD